MTRRFHVHGYCARHCECFRAGYVTNQTRLRRNLKQCRNRAIELGDALEVLIDAGMPGPTQSQLEEAERILKKSKP